jgi:hypothetical protein
VSLTQLTATLEAPLNQGNAGLFAQLQAFLAAAALTPGIIIQDVDWYRFESTYSASIQRLRIAYLQAAAPAIGLTYLAALYEGTGGTDAATQFNAAMAGGLPLLPEFVIDVSDHNRVRLDHDALIVLGPNTTLPGLVGSDQAAWIGQPVAPILAGASGSAVLFDATGTNVGTVTVTNVGAVTWVAGERNYVIMDEVTGQFIGLPACVGAAALGPVATSTTTAYPCPTIVNQTLPNTATLPP